MLAKLTFIDNLRKECGFGTEVTLDQIQTNAPRVTVSKLSANALVGKLGKKIKNIFQILWGDITFNGIMLYELSGFLFLSQ